MTQNLFLGQTNAAFSYIILRLTYILGLILEFGRDFPIEHVYHR